MFFFILYYTILCIVNLGYNSVAVAVQDPSLCRCLTHCSTECCPFTFIGSKNNYTCKICYSL